VLFLVFDSPELFNRAALATFGGNRRCVIKKKLKSNQHDYELEAAICKALANPTRLQLVAMLECSDHWSAELQTGLGISKANLSQHLGILKSAGLVATRREGKRLYCRLSMPEVKQAMTLLRGMIKIQAR
jgi:DNA-binding transcriptional ArsR family regulator